MRLIGTFSHENQARRFSDYLTRQGIDHECDPSFLAETGEMRYAIWVHSEDRLAEAEREYQKFVESPSAPQYDPPIVEQIREMAERPPPPLYYGILTPFVIALCTFFFFLNAFQEVPMREEGLSEATFLLTPIQALFLYDLPPSVERLEQIIEEHALSPDQKIEEIPPEVREEVLKLQEAPFWRGAYEWLFLKWTKQNTALGEGPLFDRISKGEVWRLFTPTLLHSELLHILFNMIWVWILGRQVEARLGVWRTSLLTLGCGIGSNTAQYLMSGPFFIGYSGVVMGLAAFIGMRQRIAPWEGYPLHRSTFLFLLIYVGIMFLLQCISFVVQVGAGISFAPNIANTAHIMGGLLGASLGRLPLFSQQVRRRA